jgi:hypothetical protein
MAEINAQISILSRYDDQITIAIYDTDSSAGRPFVELELTREQFINAAMNRLANCDVRKAQVNHLDRVGKRMETQKFEFEIPPEIEDREMGLKTYAKTILPIGWASDLSFSSQDSFFTNDDGRRCARVVIRRWVEKED